MNGFRRNVLPSRKGVPWSTGINRLHPWQEQLAAKRHVSNLTADRSEAIAYSPYIGI